LEEQQRREREAAAAAALRRNTERHECNANASPDVKQTLKVGTTRIKPVSKILMVFLFLDISDTKKD
jgi:hypothetical protein